MQEFDCDNLVIANTFPTTNISWENSKPEVLFINNYDISAVLEIPIEEEE